MMNLKKKKGYLLTICAFLLLLAGCAQEAKSVPLPVLEGMPVFENTNWGMDEEAVLEGLGISWEACEITIYGGKYIEYKVNDYKWQGWPAELTLTFNSSTLSNGETVGFTAAGIYLKDAQVTLQTVGKKLEEMYGLQGQSAQLEDADSELFWRLGVLDLPVCAEYKEEVETELGEAKMLAGDIVSIYAEAGEDRPVFISIGGGSAAIYNKAATGLEKRKPAAPAKDAKGERPILEDVLTFENLYWGMNEAQAMEALGIQESDCQISETDKDLENGEKYKLYKVYTLKEYEWQGMPAQLLLCFNVNTLTEGETIGLGQIIVQLDGKETSPETIKEKVTALYGLEQKDLTKTAFQEYDRLYADWIIKSHSLPSHRPYWNEVRAELERLPINIPVGVMIETGQNGTGSSIVISFSGNAQAVYRHVADRYSK